MESSKWALCPKCGSDQFSANPKGFGVGKAIVGAAVTGGVGLLAGFIGSQKIYVTCLACGHQWILLTEEQRQAKAQQEKAAEELKELFGLEDAPFSLLRVFGGVLVGIILFFFILAVLGRCQ